MKLVFGNIVSKIGNLDMGLTTSLISDGGSWGSISSKDVSLNKPHNSVIRATIGVLESTKFIS